MTDYGARLIAEAITRQAKAAERIAAHLEKMTAVNANGFPALRTMETRTKSG